MKKIFLFVVGLLLIAGCNTKRGFKFDKLIKIDNSGPVGIAGGNGYLWISDSKNNRILKTDLSGNILETFDGFARPMHLSWFDGKLYVPEYLTDSIKILNNNGEIDALSVSISPEAPGGIDVNKSLIAIADFYNHRIIVKSGDNTFAFGTKGHNSGELFYPTDVKIAKGKIIVADAYNNRIQIFTSKGKHLSTIGENDGIKVASGVEANSDYIFVSDSENNRVLIYDWKGTKIFELTENLKYPIDIFATRHNLFVSNFHGSSISVFNF